MPSPSLGYKDSNWYEVVKDQAAGMVGWERIRRQTLHRRSAVIMQAASLAYHCCCPNTLLPQKILQLLVAIHTRKRLSRIKKDVLDLENNFILLYGKHLS